MYVSTHGWPGQIRFYRPRWVGTAADNADWTSRKRDQNNQPDNIGPRLGDICGSDRRGWERNLWEIGASYRGDSVSRTTSRWNDDIEWVFLAACGQLSAYGNSPGSRALYARTLLGEPRRAHGIMGYYSTAPGDATDVGIVDSFFNLLAQGHSIRYAWLHANSFFTGSSRHAAVMLHERHTHEGLPPVAPRQADSPAGGTVDLRYWYLNVLNTPVGGGSASASADEPLFTRVFDSIRAFLSLPEAVASPERQRLLRGRSTTYRVVTAIPETPSNVRSLVLKDDRRSADQIARQELGANASTVREPAFAGASIARDGKRSVIVFDSGNSILKEGEEHSLKPARIRREEAVRIAESFLKSRGRGLPPDAVLDTVKEVRSARIDPVTGGTEDEATHGYVIEYRHAHDGIRVAGLEGDVISVVVNGDGGVGQVRRTWRELAQRGPRVDLISAESALEVLVQEGERVTGLPSEVDVSRIELVYYAHKAEVRQNSMHPAWEITLTQEGETGDVELGRVYVDARSGKVVTE